MKWIKCSERMPEIDIPVIVCDGGVEVYPAILGMYGVFNVLNEWYTNDELHISHPTHWMPLPPPPTE
ncbi:DUF551 domain-containing protein [Rosenbergiella nectarea]|uniref:DUF551 domain-containing protein n=1 Tax=Rosenbergiella nectarea TaxID=988801 RepID=UPI001F4F0F65|nr:DUF551 domain-containing protein [Rosenbergiella nectarea]